MNLYEKLQKELMEINKNFLSLKKEDIKSVTNIIKKENKDLSSNLKLINNNNCEDLINKIIETSNLAIEKLYSIILEFNSELSKIIIHSYKNNEDITSKSLEDIYLKKVSKIVNLNEKFIKTMEHNYEVFLNKKEESIVIIVNDNKKHLISSISNIIIDKNSVLKKVYKYNYLPFINYLKLYRENNSNKESNNNILEYFIKLYDDYYKNSLKEHEKELNDFIEIELRDLKEKIHNMNKLSNTKELNKLNKYLTKFADDLYMKNKNILKDSVNVLFSSNKEQEFRKYSSEIEKIYNVSYKFDKVFNDYKVSNQNILLSNKIYNKISKTVDSAKNEIEQEFMSNMISLYKDSSEYLNTLIYKIIICEYQNN